MITRLRRSRQRYSAAIQRLRRIKRDAGANVKKIGGQAFYGCKKLKKITVSSKTIQSIGKKAFANIDKKVKITVPKAKQKDYKKMFQKAKAPKTAKFIKK